MSRFNQIRCFYKTYLILIITFIMTMFDEAASHSSLSTSSSLLSTRIATNLFLYSTQSLFYSSILIAFWLPSNCHAFDNIVNIPSHLALNATDNRSDSLQYLQQVPSPSMVTPKPLSSSSSSASFPFSGQSPSKQYAILDFRNNLNRQLKSIQDKELLVPTIQNLFDSNEPISLTGSHNDTKIIIQLMTKMEMKFTRAIRAVNETRATILDILISTGHQRKINSSDINNDDVRNVFLESIILPCSTKASDKMNAREDNSNSDETIDNKNSIEILNYLNNAGHLHEMDDKNFTVNSRLMEAIKTVDMSSNAAVANFRDVYFLAKDNYGSASNCRTNFPNEQYRRLFASTIKPRNILMIIDHGASAANDEQFDLTKTFASNIIDLLNENDRLTVVGVSNVATSFNTYFSQQQQNVKNSDNYYRLYRTNRENKKNIFKYLDSLNKTREITNHTMAFEYSFKLVENILRLSKQSEGRKIPMNRSPPVLMLYISRGLVSQMSEAKIVLDTIAIGQSRLDQPIVINTCAIILDEKRVMYEKQFLNDIANQNYSKYKIAIKLSNDSWHRKLLSYRNGGKLYLVNKRIGDIQTTATAAITDLWFDETHLYQAIQLHQPYYDAIVQDHVIAITQTCKEFGVFGVGLFLTDFAEDIIYYFNKYADSDETYAFLTDMNGTTIYHPSFPRPQTVPKDDVFSTNIKYLEKITDEVWQRWRNEIHGNISWTTQWHDHAKKKIYTWHHVAQHFIVCIARVWYLSRPNKATENQHSNHQSLGILSIVGRSEYLIGNSNSSSEELNSDVVYHRLDLAFAHEHNRPNEKICRYFKQLSIHNTVTLFLGAGAFKSPFSYLETMCPSASISSKPNQEQCIHKIESIMAYIRDTTNLLTNPGLHSHVRNDVFELTQFIELLRNRHNSNENVASKYIIRRYVTSMNGVILMYPGMILPNDFEPSRRPWFRKAMENMAKLSISPPYLDAGGAGYIVTISHTIYESSDQHLNRRRKRRHHSSSSGQKKIAAIVSIDVTRGFLYQILLESSSFCQSDMNIKCFLIDDMGYLVVHPSILDPSIQSVTNTGQTPADNNFNRRTSIMEHITHKESLIANDILLHRSLVEKRLCQNLLNRKIQRYYKFNTSMTEVLSNIVNGERSKYQVATISNTNLLIVMLNSTDGDGGAAFCPCSTIDRICFNCNRVEPMNCECPCECSLNTLSKSSTINEYMYGDLLDDDELTADRKINIFERIDICPSPIEEFNPVLLSDSIEVTNKLDTLSTCINYTCEQYTGQLDCLGILGCEWCQVDIDGETLLSSPFCTHQSACFGGILGSVTPYGDGDLGAVVIDSMLPSAYAAIGPVAGAVFVLCLIIGFAMYCYRHNLDPGSEQLYIESMPVEHNFGLPLSRLDYDSISPHNGSDVLDKINNTAAVPSDISPYRMHAGNFRRPNGESDHGYSTMTPHEDSDHACFTLIEPLINSKHMSVSDSTSLNADPIATNSSSPMSYHQNMGKIKDEFGTITPASGYDNTGATILSSPHHIQAPVTVHQPMEAQ